MDALVQRYREHPEERALVQQLHYPTDSGDCVHCRVHYPCALRWAADQAAPIPKKPLRAKAS